MARADAIQNERQEFKYRPVTDEFDNHETSLPGATSTMKKVAKIAMGSGAGGTALWMMTRRARTRRKSQANQRGVAAAVAAVVPAHLLPENWQEKLTETVKDRRVQREGMVAAGLYMALKAAEIRRTRALVRAFTGPRRSWRRPANV